MCRSPLAGADGPLIAKLLRWWYVLNFERDKPRSKARTPLPLG